MQDKDLEDVISRSNVFRDPRVDKLVSWVLAGFVTIALSVSVNSFSSLALDIRGLRKAVETLNTRVSVMETHGKRIEEHLGYRVERVDLRLEQLQHKLDQYIAAQASKQK